MWQLVKTELRYYLIAYSAPLFFTILSQIFEILTLSTMSNMEQKTVNINNGGNWGGFYYFIILYSFIIIWQKRHKEKRIRYFRLLPVSDKQLAIARALFALAPFLIFEFYIISIQLIIKSFWNIQLTTPVTEFGVISILLAITILIYDSWFSKYNLRTLFLTIVIIICNLVFIILMNLSSENTILISIFGNHSGLLFYILAILTLTATIFSYQKRTSYLN